MIIARPARDTIITAIAKQRVVLRRARVVIRAIVQAYIVANRRGDFSRIGQRDRGANVIQIKAVDPL